jgi:hypothetical protein
MADAEARGLPSVARLLIGYPCLSGAANAAFWAALCQAGTNPEVSGCACDRAADRNGLGRIVAGASGTRGGLHHEPGTPG